MASEGEDGGTGEGGDGVRPAWRRLQGGAATVAPPAPVRLIREFKGRTVADQQRAAAALPGRVSAVRAEAPAGTTNTSRLLPGPGARRRAARRRWLLGGGALALVVAAALALWLCWLAGSR